MTGAAVRVCDCDEENGLRRPIKSSGIGVAVVALSLVSGAASAQTAPPVAQAHAGSARPVAPPSPKKLLASADDKRKAGDCDGALTEYLAVDIAASSPQTTYGIAACRDKLGHYAEALRGYDAFLANVPPSMSAEADDAKARVLAIHAMPGHLHVETTPSNAVVSIDGKEQPTHTPLDVDVPVGKHVLHVTLEGHDPLDKEVEVAFLAKQDLALELALTPPPPPPAPPPPPPPVIVPPQPRSKIPAYVTGAIAIVSAGIGTGFGIAAINDKKSFDKNPTNATANSGEDHALVSDMGFGIALTLGVTAVILFTTRDEGLEPPAPSSAPAPAKAAKAGASFTAAPFVSPHGGGAGAQLRF
jgi:PEGA domain